MYRPLQAALPAAVLVLQACTAPRLAPSQLEGVPPSLPLVVVRAEGAFNLTWFDGPIFLLFQDGLALYQVARTSDPIPRYRAVVLSPADRDSLLGFVAREFATLDTLYAPFPDVTDLAHYVVGLWRERGYRRIHAVGGLWPGAYWRQGLPPRFVALYDSLAGFERAAARDWRPTAIQALLWPVDTTESARFHCDWSKAIRWPRSWPTTIDSTAGHRYLVWLRPSELQRLVQLQRRAGNYVCTPVHLAGRFWFLGYRYVFPGEEAWVRWSP